MEINQQSILKAFFLFDKNKLFLAERPSADRISQRKAMAAEWLDAFCTLPTDIWEDAVALAIRCNKHWPSVSEMWSYINASMEPPQEPEPEHEKPKPAASLSSVDKLHRMIELAKQGRFNEAKQTLGVTSKINQDNFIQEHWPDAAERIKANHQDELREILRQEEICQHCPGMKRCQTRGYRKVGYMDKSTGSLCVRMVPCKERREEKQ